MAFTKMNSRGESPQFSDEELEVMLRELRGVLEAGIAGDVVELGCYRGETSVHLARFLKRLAPEKNLYVYDSFEGLPPKSIQDESPAGSQFVAGELPASKKEVVGRLKAAGFGGTRVKKAWFSDLGQEDLPSSIAFAFLDGDFYHSIMDSLKLVWPLMEPGSVVVVDDYRNESLPGASRAVDHWLSSHPAKFRTEESLAILKVQ